MIRLPDAFITKCFLSKLSFWTFFCEFRLSDYDTVWNKTIGNNTAKNIHLERGEKNSWENMFGQNSVEKSVGDNTVGKIQFRKYIVENTVGKNTVCRMQLGKIQVRKIQLGNTVCEIKNRNKE